MKISWMEEWAHAKKRDIELKNVRLKLRYVT
jgi:hypothetical protein